MNSSHIINCGYRCAFANLRDVLLYLLDNTRRKPLGAETTANVANLRQSVINLWRTRSRTIKWIRDTCRRVIVTGLNSNIIGQQQVRVVLTARQLVTVAAKAITLQRHFANEVTNWIAMINNASVNTALPVILILAVVFNITIGRSWQFLLDHATSLWDWPRRL